jgi:TyrR family helix-turn-helix protein
VEYLKGRDWPGNIRELENMVQRLLISAKGETITVFDVMKELHVDLFENMEPLGTEETEEEKGVVLDLNLLVANFEKNIIKSAYEKYGSSRKAAKAIGISQSQLIRKKNKYNI